MDNSDENTMEFEEMTYFEKSFNENVEPLFHKMDANILKSTKTFASLCKTTNKILNVYSVTRIKYAKERHLISQLFLGKVITINANKDDAGKVDLIEDLLKTSIHTPIFFWTGKNSTSQLTRYFMSVLANLPLHNLSTQNINENDKRALLKLEEIIDDYDIYINENVFNNLAYFKQECEKMIEEKGVQIIVTDSLELLKLDEKEISTKDSIKYIDQSLQQFAKDKNICIISVNNLKNIRVNIFVLFIFNSFVSGLLLSKLYIVFTMLYV